MAKSVRPDRSRRPRKIRRRFIIACEGHGEYWYFSELNQLLRGRQQADLSVIRGDGGTAENAVHRALRQRERDKEDGKFNLEYGDRVYAIIDVEPHDPTKGEPLSKAMALATKEKISVLLSNPSFEFWLLCHIAEAAELKRRFANPDAVTKAMNKFVSPGKGKLQIDRRLIEQFVPKALNAVKVARHVHEGHHHSRSDIRNANACTEVYRLVEFLLGDVESPP